MEDLKSIEYIFLSERLAFPKETREAADWFNITPEDFSCEKHAAAWRLMSGVENDDQAKLLIAARKGLELGDDTNAADAFINASISTAYIAAHAQQIATAAYTRRLSSSVTSALARPDAGNAAMRKTFVTEAINSVDEPKSVLPGYEAPNTSKPVMMDEVPEELLHIPGFIDSLVEYSMNMAHYPHRTLAFSGALALLSHLMGRIYTEEYHDTRSNLYVIAIGETGIGKESARRVNRRVLAESRMAQTIYDSPASGEAIEDTLSMTPSALFQIDEIQELIGSLKDNRNVVAQRICKALLSFFSSSGSTHTLRVKAIRQGENTIGRVIHDPSLTLYGTGVSHGVYQALSIDMLENGLLGRCLVFEAIEKSDRQMKKSKNISVPEIVRQYIAQLEESHLRIPANTMPTPKYVPYGDGAAEKLDECMDAAEKLRKSAKRENDLAAMALWARAAEKTAKIALIHAVSENLLNPQITVDIVDHSWRLVKCLTERMIVRADRWITDGKTDEYCRYVLDYLDQHNGTASRRDVMRARGLRTLNKKDFELIVEETLVARGEIKITEVARGKVQYTRI